MIREGILNLNKPAGMTSHDCVNILRRLTGVRRIGHTGTLDPMATGVLPLCIGGAARITEYLDMDFKTYACEMTLGLETDTQDIWGNILRDERELLKESIIGGTTSCLQIRDPGLNAEKISDAFKSFSGLIDQYPPKYSAVRVGGRRLYEYARAGEEVQIKSRQVYIREINVDNIDLDNLKVEFCVTCSKGTYIRTICQDVGVMLGCGATLSKLTRLASGVFTLENSVEASYLQELYSKKKELEATPEQAAVSGQTEAEAGLAQIEAEVNKLLFPPDYLLVYFGKILVSEERGIWFCNGGTLKPEDVRVLQEPYYKDSEPPMEIRKEYREAYKVYMEGSSYGTDNDAGYKQEVENTQGVFLGVAFYDSRLRRFVADKVIAR